MRTRSIAVIFSVSILGLAGAWLLPRRGLLPAGPSASGREVVGAAPEGAFEYTKRMLKAEAAAAREPGMSSSIASAAGNSIVPKTSEEARQALEKANASLDLVRGFTMNLSGKNGSPIHVKMVDGVQCYYRQLTTKPNGPYYLHNSEGEWMIAKDGAYRMDFLPNQQLDIVKHLAQGDAPKVEPSTYRTIDDGGDYYTIVEEISPGGIALFYETLEAPTLKSRTPVGTDFSGYVPITRTYKMSKADGSLLAWDAYSKNGKIEGSSGQMTSTPQAGLPDDLFRIPSTLIRVPVQSSAELIKFRREKR